MMMREGKVPRELLRQLLYGWKTDDELMRLVEDHPELAAFRAVAVPMLSGMEMVMSILGQQLFDDEELEEFDVTQNAHMGKNILQFMWDKEFMDSIPNLPQAAVNEILAKAEPGEEMLEVLLTLVAGAKYPDYLTEESFWLMQAMVSGAQAKFAGQCERGLGFCLRNGVNREFMMGLVGQV